MRAVVKNISNIINNTTAQFGEKMNTDKIKVSPPACAAYHKNLLFNLPYSAELEKLK